MHPDFSALYGWYQGEDKTIKPDDGTTQAEFKSAVYTKMPGDLEGRRTKATDFYSLAKPSKLYQAMLQIENMGAKVNDSCALHVHIGLTGNYGLQESLAITKQFAINYLALEEKLAVLNKPSADNYYDIYDEMKLTLKDVTSAILSATNFKEIAEALRPDSLLDSTKLKEVKRRQRSKLNLKAIDDHGTIECRHHPGTVNAQEVKAWVEFLDHLFTYSELQALSPKGPRIPGEIAMKEMNDMVDDFLAERAKPVVRETALSR